MPDDVLLKLADFAYGEQEPQPAPAANGSDVLLRLLEFSESDQPKPGSEQMHALVKEAGQIPWEERAQDVGAQMRGTPGATTRSVLGSLGSAAYGLLGGANRLVGDKEAATEWEQLRRLGTRGVEIANEDSFMPKVVNDAIGNVVGAVATATAAGPFTPVVFAADANNAAKVRAEEAGLEGWQKEAYAGTHAAIAALFGHLIQKIPGLSSGEAVPAEAIKSLFTTAGAKAVLKESAKQIPVLAGMNISGRLTDAVAGLAGPVTLDDLGSAIGHAAIEAPLFVLGGRGLAQLGPQPSRSELKTWAEANPEEAAQVGYDPKAKLNEDQRAEIAAKVNESAAVPPVEQPAAPAEIAPPPQPVGEAGAPVKPLLKDRRHDWETRNKVREAQDLEPEQREDFETRQAFERAGEEEAPEPPTEAQQAPPLPQERRGEAFQSQEQVEIAKLKQSGWTDSDIAEAQTAGLFAKDEVTGFHEGRSGTARRKTIQRAIEHVKTTGTGGLYVELDLRNLGGLNEKLGHTGSNEVWRSFSDVVKQELEGTGADVHLFRHGGDEMSAVVVNGKKEIVQAALESAQQKIDNIVKERGLDQIPHPKRPGERGTGIHFGLGELNPNLTIDENIKRADLQIEAKKKGFPNVNRGAAETAGTGAPERQAIPATVGTAETNASVGPEGSGPTADVQAKAGSQGQEVKPLTIKERRLAAERAKEASRAESVGGKTETGSQAQGAGQAKDRGLRVRNDEESGLGAGKGRVPETPPDVAFKLEKGEGQSVTRKHIEESFPGTQVEDTKPGAWKVTLKGGESFHVRQQDKVEMSDEQWQQARKAYPNLSENDRASVTIAGSLEIKGEHGDIDGIALMKLANGQDQPAALKHETLHLARRLGLFSDAEWKALTEKYSDLKKNEASQEEDVANAAEVWYRDGKIAKWIKSFLKKVGITKGLDADQAEKLIEQAEFWERKVQLRQGKRFVEVKFKGRPDLANFVNSPQAREFVNKMDELRGQPAKVTDKEAFEQADKLLAQPRRTEALKKHIVNGEQLNNEETLAARRLAEDAIEKAWQTGDVADKVEAMALSIGYRLGGSEQARAMRNRRDRIETPVQRYARAAKAAFLEPSRAAFKLIMEAHKKGDKAEVKRLTEKAANDQARMAEKYAVTPEEIDKRSKAQDVGWFAEKQRQYASDHLNWSDITFEYYVNSILSGLKTQVVNLLGTTSFASWVQAVEKNAASMLWGRGGKLEREVRWKGLMQGLSEGWRNAIITFQHEIPGFEYAHGRKGVGDIEDMQVAIPGKVGRFIRIPGRALMAADAFNKSWIGRMEAGVAALEIAQKEGAKGPELTKRISELMADKESEAWNKGIREAQLQTFQELTTPVGQSVFELARAARNRLPMLRFMPFTFIKTPPALIERAYERSPFAAIGYAADALHWLRKAETPEQAAAQTKALAELKDPERFVRVALGSALTTAVAGLVWYGDDEDKTPRITGTFPYTAKGASDLKYRMGWQPQSIRINGNWYSYARLDPLATILSGVVDVLNKPQDQSAAFAVLQSAGAAMEDKTFLKDFGDMLKLFGSDSKEDDLKKMGLQKLSAVVPNIFKQTAKAYTPELPERRVWGKDRLGKRFVQGLELGLMPDQPKIDLWGQPIKRAEALGPDFASPVETRPVKEAFAGDRFLYAWNKAHPDDKFEPQIPRPEIIHKGEKYSLTDEQYTEMLQDGGKLARAAAEKVKWNVENPSLQQKKIFEGIIERAHKAARDRMLLKVLRESKAHAAG